MWTVRKWSRSRGTSMAVGLRVISREGLREARGPGVGEREQVELELEPCTHSRVLGAFPLR